MGIFADFLANSKSVDNDGDHTALDRAIYRDFNDIIAKGDAESPGATFEAVNEVQELAASGASAGTFDITVGVTIDGFPYQVAVTGLGFDDAPAAIQTDLDTAAALVIPGYQAGDITVSGAGTADANPTVFTYDGDSVSGQAHPLSTVDGGGLTGGGSEAFSETTDGQTDRLPWAIMDVMQLVGFTNPPAQNQATVPTLTAGSPPRNMLSDASLRCIAREAAIQDNIPGLEDAILTAMGLSTQ
jgi:hypothetical protein